MELEHQDLQPTSGAGPTRRLLDRIATRLFAAEDDRARARGWHVRPTAGGLGRSYRDPRWDLIRACENCADFGADPDCPVCGGTEVIRLDPDLDDLDPADPDPERELPTPRTAPLPTPRTDPVPTPRTDPFSTPWTDPFTVPWAAPPADPDPDPEPELDAPITPWTGRFAEPRQPIDPEPEPPADPWPTPTGTEAA